MPDSSWIASVARRTAEAEPREEGGGREEEEEEEEEEEGWGWGGLFGAERGGEWERGEVLRRSLLPPWRSLLPPLRSLLLLLRAGSKRGGGALWKESENEERRERERERRRWKF